MFLFPCFLHKKVYSQPAWIYFLFFVSKIMNSFWNKRRKIYGVLILISAFIVFFVGRTFNSEKMSRQISFAWDSIANFRRWLDISGGTRLTYRISYDTYEQVYSGNTAELAAVKSTVENIILKNIDWRISQLWVSDYKSFTQQLDNETQIVVEIWWVADLDQAKELIGKTVELEFKLPNENAWSDSEKSERTTLAQNLYNDLLANPDKFEAIAGGRQSENVYYTKYDKATISQLPNIYKNNLSVLNETPEWKISTLMKWEYHSYQYDDNSGLTQDVDLNGYTFFRMISREEWVRDGISLNDVLEVATTLWATYDDNLTLIKDWTSIESGSFAFEWNVLNYNNGEVYPNEIAYDTRILAVLPSVSTNNDESNDDTNITDDIKAQLLTNKEADISEASPVYDWVISINDLKNAITSFDVSNNDDVQVYDVEWVTYFVIIRDRKSESDHWYNFATIRWVNEESFNKSLESQMFYTFEEVFVQDTLSWTNAQSEDGKILNGANFKYAAVSTSQLGQPVVVISFDDTWKEIFCNITSNNIWKEMAIFIWWEMITSPVIQSKICDGSAQIDGNFTAESAKELTSQLNEWALPAPLILMQEEKVSPTLWENAFNGALIAMWIWFLIIYLYMTYLYWWKKWLISLISLWIYTMVLFAIVKIIDYALSLSWLAAIILSIWMAVDANVLIFERMKEEKENKKSDSETINTAYDRSRNAIRDGQISTWMIWLLLMLMWINMFKWFGTMLVVWVLLTLLINVPVIKELLHIFYRKK